MAVVNTYEGTSVGSNFQHGYQHVRLCDRDCVVRLGAIAGADLIAGLFCVGAAGPIGSSRRVLIRQANR